MKVQIEPQVALCDEKLNIVVTELQPFEKIKISASMRLPWAEDVLFESYACFTADSDGIVDLSRYKPDYGTYDFVDSMGLVISMKSRDKNALKKIAADISISKSQYIDFVIESGEKKSSIRVERKFVADGVMHERISDEFVGELFYGDSPNRKTIVFLGGSGSKLDVNSPIAAVLASHGFNVLSLPYFNEKGLPTGLADIPLEYFERAFEWLKRDARTRCNEIFILGMSKGAELSLLLASRNKSITRVAALAPHAYSFQGITFRNKPSWTYRKKPLPYVRLKNSWIFAYMLKCIVKNQPFGFSPIYKKGVNSAKNREAARIRVEESKGDLLLFAGKQNNIWNSYDGCSQIISTLRKSNYSHSYDLITYEDAGEPFYVPYVIPAGENSMKMAPRLVLSSGGTIQGNAYAISDSWKRTIEFFHR